MNNNTHPCAGKCSEFKEGGQCFHCLINETVNRGVYSMHRTEHRINTNDLGDDTHIENHISPLCKTESQPVLIVERDNQIIERLKVENVVLQAKVDELQAENKILNQAASSHLKNQNHFMDLYHNLVWELYPYAIDLQEPLQYEESSGRSKDYVDAYNRAYQAMSATLLEMMQGDEKYIRMQCGMMVGVL